MFSFPSQVFTEKRKAMTQLKPYNMLFKNMLIQISELVYLCKQPAVIIKMRTGKFQQFLIFKRKYFLLSSLKCPLQFEESC